MKAVELLKEARHASGLSQRRLAIRSGVPQSAIARIETGRVVPRVDTLERLLVACGRTLEAAPASGAGVDRSLIREMLRLTPDERITYAVASSKNVAALMGELRT